MRYSHQYINWSFINKSQNLSYNLSPESWWSEFSSYIKSAKNNLIYYENLHENYVYTDESIYLKKIDEYLRHENKYLFISLSGNEKNKKLCKERNKLTNIKFWILPTFHLFFINNDNEYTNTLRKKQSIYGFNTLFINLNNHYKFHKHKLVEYLIEENLNNYGTITYLDDKTNDWKEKTTKIDRGPRYDGLFNLSLYKSPLIDLVSESEYDIFRITEKTWKPLLLGQIFLVCGSKNFHNNLQDMGFKLYDNIFDYSFDTEYELDSRIRGIADNLLRIKDQNYFKIYMDSLPIIRHNQKRCNEILQNYEFIPKSYLEFSKRILMNAMGQKENSFFLETGIFRIIN